MAIGKIFDKALQTPNKTAVVYNGVAFSYSLFASLIAASREYLGQQQIPGDCVAIVANTTLLEGWVLGLALRSLGLTTFAARNYSEIAKLATNRTCCIVAGAYPGKADLGQRAADSGWRVIRTPAEVLRGAVQSSISGATAISTRQGGHIIMTSGTTGAYKMVVRDAALEELVIPLLAEINGITEQSIVYVSNFGLWTAGGYRWPLMAWSTGGTVVIHQAPDLHAPLAQHELTHMFSTPSLLITLLEAADGKLRRSDSMRLLVTGGALTQALLAAAKRHVTQQVFSVLSSSEALTLAVTPLDQPDDLLWHRIHPSREVQVVDEAGNVLGPGVEGLIRVRIIDGLSGYLDDEATTREFFRDGFFYPGDLGLFGSDGRLSLRGRASDVINILGDKIATGPVERALQDRLGVAGACLVSIQNAAGEDEIYVVIESPRPIERAKIEAASGHELSAFRRVPVRVVFRDKLPRNEMGKIQRLVLKQQLLNARARNGDIVSQTLPSPGCFPQSEAFHSIFNLELCHANGDRDGMDNGPLAGIANAPVTRRTANAVFETWRTAEPDNGPMSENHRVIKLVDQSEAIKGGSAILFDVQCADGAKLSIECPFEEVSRLVHAISHAAYNAEKLQKLQPGQTISVVRPYTARDARTGISADGKLVAIEFQTMEGNPIQIAMSPELVRAVTSRLQDVLNNVGIETRPKTS